MIRVIYRILLLLSLVILASCSGTGTKTSLLYNEVNTEETKIFIKRSTGLAGVAVLIKVKLNDTILGELGENEAFTAIPKVGFNTLRASFTIKSFLAASHGVNSFEIKEGENLFFVIKQDMGVIRNKLKIYNVDKTNFFMN